MKLYTLWILKSQVQDVTYKLSSCYARSAYHCLSEWIDAITFVLQVYSNTSAKLLNYRLLLVYANWSKYHSCVRLKYSFFLENCFMYEIILFVLVYCVCNVHHSKMQRNIELGQLKNYILKYKENRLLFICHSSLEETFPPSKQTVRTRKISHISHQMLSSQQQTRIFESRQMSSFLQSDIIKLSIWLCSCVSCRARHSQRRTEQVCDADAASSSGVKHSTKHHKMLWKGSEEAFEIILKSTVKLFLTETCFFDGYSTDGVKIVAAVQVILTFQLIHFLLCLAACVWVCEEFHFKSLCVCATWGLSSDL